MILLFRKETKNSFFVTETACECHKNVRNCNLVVCLNIIVGDDAYIVPLLCSRADVGIRPYKSKLYIVANNYPAVGTGVLDCPFMVNFTRTVWKPVPTNIIVCNCIQFIAVGDDAHIVPLYIHGRM